MVLSGIVAVITIGFSINMTNVIAFLYLLWNVIEKWQTFFSMLTLFSVVQNFGQLAQKIKFINM